MLQSVISGPKGQLISKCLFGERKQVNLRYHKSILSSKYLHCGVGLFIISKLHIYNEVFLKDI